MDGRATFTIDTSRITMNCARQHRIRMSVLLRAAASAGLTVNDYCTSNSSIHTEWRVHVSRQTTAAGAPGGAPAAAGQFVSRDPLLGGGVRVRQDRDDAPTAAGLEVDDAGRLGEQRVVLAHADALAGLEARAALADEDLAAGDDLAGEDLDPEELGVRVAAVLGGAEALLMRHASSLSLRDLGHPDAGELLAVAHLATVAPLGLELVDPQLGAAQVLDDLGGHRDLAQLVAEQGFVSREQEGLEVELGAGVARQPLDEQGLALLDAVLLATGLDDRVHGLSLLRSRFGLDSRTAPSASAAAAPRLGF